MSDALAFRLKYPEKCPHCGVRWSEQHPESNFLPHVEGTCADRLVKESVCAACETPINDNQSYASIGGNIVPYMPAKLYHIRCFPTLKPSGNSLSYTGIKWIDRDGVEHCWPCECHHNMTILAPKV
jgi:hypothetical protein